MVRAVYVYKAFDEVPDNFTDLPCMEETGLGTGRKTSLQSTVCRDV